MKRLPIGEAETRRYVELRKEHQLALPAVSQFIAEMYPIFEGRSIHAVIALMRERCMAFGLPTTFAPELIPIAERLPQTSPVTQMLEGLDLPYEDSLVFSDCHFPHHYRDMLAWGLKVAKVRGIKRLILAGDTFDFDCFSSFLKVKSEDPATNFDTVAEFFAAALPQFETICVIMGNHDERILRRLELKMGISLLMSRIHDLLPAKQRISFAKRVLYTDRFYMTMYGTPDGVSWRISHPDNYRKLRLSVSIEGAMKYNCHFLSAHQHHLGVTVSTYGHKWAVDGGCGIDPVAAEYIQRRDKMSADWSPGFITLEHGHPHVFSATDSQAYQRASIRPGR